MSKTTKKKKNTKNRFSNLKKRYSNAQLVTLSIIILSIFTVFIALIAAFFLQPEKRVLSTIDKLASEYYEDYIYKSAVEVDQSGKPINAEKALEKYQTNGLTPVPLSELLLYQDQKNQKYAELLTKYCDENATYIHFYPEPPFNKTSYRKEYTYSCNF